MKLIGLNSFKGQGEGLNFAVSIGDIEKFLVETAKPLPSKVSTAEKCKPKKLFDGRNKANDSHLTQIDSSCSGFSDFSLLTPDDKTQPILALIDSNHDKKIDIIVQDLDRDGRWDISYHDIDFDGTIDLIGYHPDGKLQASRYERYVANR